MISKKPISSSELGTLWLTYQEKTLIMRILEYFIEKTDNAQAKNIMGGLWQDLDYYVKKIKQLFIDEGAVVPIGFTKEDVNLAAPKLYDNDFDITFIRILKEVSMGMYTINMNMAYRDDIMEIYAGLTSVTHKVYKLATLYLLENGILTIPPNVTMPRTTETVESKDYLNGLNPFSQKRVLNTLELSYLHHGIETNNVGIQLITGFAQSTQNKEVREHFLKGLDLAKKQIKTYEKILHQNDIQVTAALSSTVTDSKVAPFSDKLMMYCEYLLNGFGIVGTSFGTIFSLRNDISLKTSSLTKDIFFYAHDGIKIMIKNGWFEEPPQMEDRTGLLKN